MSSTAPTADGTPGFQWPGGNATVVRGLRLDAPIRGANWSGGGSAGTPHRGIQARGIALSSGVAGAQFSPRVAGKTKAVFGGQWDGPVTDSVSSLIDTEGFAVVLARRQGSGRLAFSPDEPPHRGLQSVSWTEEANAMVSWSATVPANRDLWDWPFSRAVVAYGGDRRLHGTLLNINERGGRDGEVTLGGYGPLYWAGHGHIEASYSDMAAHRALEDVWLRVARETDGRVRGTVVRPRPEHIDEHVIPPEGVEWSGTPMEVLKEAHGYAGQAFAADHSEPATVYSSFVPGEELREAGWRATNVDPSITTEGYHNQITVVGAAYPSVSEEDATIDERYSATVTAPRAEVGRVMNGQIHSRTEYKDQLTSDAACRAHGNTLLAEDRGEYTVGGALDVAPDVRNLVPGYTYRVGEFDRYAPGFFTPVYATLRAVTHTHSLGEASVGLEFDDENGLVQHIRNDLLPDNAPRTLKRRSAQQNAADENYNRPMDLNYTYGDGIWGTGRFGGTRDTI